MLLILLLKAKMSCAGSISVELFPKGQNMKRLLLLSVFTLVCFYSYSQNEIRAEIKSHGGIYYDVFISTNEISTNVTNFSPWEYIRFAELSPSTEYLLVWHKPENGKHTISVYETQSYKRIAHYAEGFGGKTYWTPGNKIVRTWGCGTYCSIFVLYDPYLNEIQLPPSKELYAPILLSLSPDNRYAAFIDKQARGIQLIDLDSQTVVKEVYNEQYDIFDVIYTETSVIAKNADDEELFSILLVD